MILFVCIFTCGLLLGLSVALWWRSGDLCALRDCVEWQHGESETLKRHLRDAQDRLKQHRAAANYRLSAEDLARRFNERNPHSHAKTDQVEQPESGAGSALRRAVYMRDLIRAARG